MALDTYANLKTAVADRINRTDMADEIVDFITLSETEIRRWLRTLWNQRRSYAVPTSAFVALPDDYNGTVSIQYESGSNRYTVEQVSPHLLDQLCPSNSTGLPRYYAIHDGQYELRPGFGASNAIEVEITYYYKPTVLSDSNTSNEILANAPDLLFYRILAEAFDHLFDEQRAAKYMGLHEKIKAELMSNDSKDRWSGAPLRARVDSLDNM